MWPEAHDNGSVPPPPQTAPPPLARTDGRTTVRGAAGTAARHTCGVAQQGRRGGNTPRTCNTASTVVLPHLREEFGFHVIGVVPAIKPAAELSKTKKIGLLATPATIDRSYTDQLINKFANNCQVTRIGSSDLVQLAEDKLYGRPLDESIISTILKPITDDLEIDVLVQV